MNKLFMSGFLELSTSILACDRSGPVFGARSLTNVMDAILDLPPKWTPEGNAFVDTRSRRSRPRAAWNWLRCNAADSSDHLAWTALWSQNQCLWLEISTVSPWCSCHQRTLLDNSLEKSAEASSLRGHLLQGAVFPPWKSAKWEARPPRDNLYDCGHSFVV